jgi:hypothetical protein
MWTFFLDQISGLLIAVIAIWWSSSVYAISSANLAGITLRDIEVIGTADTAWRDLAIFKTKARTALIACGAADDAANATPAPQDFRHAGIGLRFEMFGIPDVNPKVGKARVTFRWKGSLWKASFFKGSAT